jgi:hypothetical protein
MIVTLPSGKRTGKSKGSSCGLLKESGRVVLSGVRMNGFPRESHLLVEQCLFVKREELLGH